MAVEYDLPITLLNDLREGSCFVHSVQPDARQSLLDFESENTEDLPRFRSFRNKIKKMKKDREQ